ncbi:MAG: hypothetical protein KDA65_12045 [Planctomycetaceae bacterium]|nr:hypothetical protein [Planctomycetaceae bacterium]
MYKLMAILSTTLLFSGCQTIQTDANKAMMETKRQLRIKPSDYNDGTEDLDEDWSFVGEQGRGDMPKEKESDGLTNFLESEKARSINRNLGIY